MARPPYASFPLPPPPPALSVMPPDPEDHEGPKISLEELADNSTAAADILTLVCFAVFAFLIGFDVWRAYKKRATWLPGKAFALSGVTVQIIVWWTSLSNIQSGYEKDVGIMLHYHYMVVSGRVAVCVFIGYLLPGMAAPSVRAYGALAITISAQIVSELLLLYNPADIEPDSEYYIYSDWCKECHSAYDVKECTKKSYSELVTRYLKRRKGMVTRTEVTDMVLIICIIVLGLILCCTILASKTIHGLLKQRNSAIAEESKFQLSKEKMKSVSPIIDGKELQSSNEKTKVTWYDFEDEVLKSWFVARVCQIDYVICRSVLSSAVWVIVTICVIVFYYRSHGHYKRYYRSHGHSGHYIPPTYPLLCFIVVGWLVICWRWLAAQFYWSPRHSWKRWLYWEHFWTSHTVQLIDMYDLKGKRQKFQKFQKSNSKMPWLNKLQSPPTRIFTKIRLHKLLYLVFVIQVCVVFFSKVCGLLSAVIVGEFVYWCRRFVCLCRKRITKEEESVISHEIYTENLQCLCMPGEDPSAMREANKMSFNKAKSLMKKGFEEGSSSQEINSIFRQYSMEWAKEGTQLLKLLKGKAIPSVLSHFPSVEKKYLKMTIVSIITIFIRLHKAKSDDLTKVVKACRQVWDLVSFAEECDIDVEADKINLIEDLNKENDQVCMAANMAFYELQMEYEKLPSKCEDCVLDTGSVHGFLKDLREKCEEVLRGENILEGKTKFSKDLRDSKNWTKISASYNLYKLCKLMQDKDIEDYVAWTEESLRNVIAYSMSKLPDMIVQQCWIWAQEFQEDKLWEAIQLAGKCMGTMKFWGQMSISCRPVEELPRQGDQTMSNTEQCTIEVDKPPNQGVSTLT